MTKLTGQCLCGTVTYAADSEIIMQANCHCTDCRQSSGSPFATLVFIKKDDLDIQGEVKTFDHVVDSGNKLTKIFCPNCGSQLFTANEVRPNSIGIRAGTLNEHQEVKPQFNVFASGKMACTHLDPNIPAFDKMPG